MKLGLRDRLNLALGQDSGLVVSPAEAETHPGFSTEYLVSLGLTKVDLKKLERKGLVSRGYTKNVWVGGETMPNGKVAAPGTRYHGRGMRTRWIFVVGAT